MSTYSLSGYASMLADPVRVDAYEAALAEAITPGCTVLEIGTGTGFFAVLACRLGAGLVHAVEPDDSIQVARELAEANGVADRIVFHQDLSTRITLPEPADVLVADLRGVLPLFQSHVHTVADARARLLKPDGIQIPLRDRIVVAPVSAEEAYLDRVQPWGDHHRGMDLSTTTRRLANAWSKARLKPRHLAAEPARWAELDYTRIVEPGRRGALDFTLADDRTLHGFAAWFDTDLTESVGFSNAPDAPDALYGHAFFPLLEPLEGRAGAVLQLDLRAHFVNDDYVWEWRTRLGDIHLSQSTLAGAVLSPERFRRGASHYAPRLSDDARVDAFVLGAMDGAATVGEIARRVLDTFPERFADERAALNRVSALARDRGE